MNLGDYHPLQRVCDSMMLIIMLWRVPGHRKARLLPWLGGMMLLVSSEALYASGVGITANARFFCRIAVYAVIFHIIKKTAWPLSLYYAVFAVNCLSACQSVFFTPLLAGDLALWGPMTGSTGVDWVVYFLLKNVPMLLVFCAVVLGAPLNKMRSVAFFEWAVILLLAFCSAYTKRALYCLSTAGSPTELSVFVIILQIIHLAFLIFFERYIYSQRTQRELQMQEIANHYHMQSLQTVQHNQAMLRSLHHDMKNHLLAIRKLSEPADNERLQQYLSTLLQDVSEYELTVETGNEVLNGLLAEKLLQAEKLDTQIDVLVDLSGVDFLEDRDICTLFGNALDNALEACSHLPEGECRRITVRSQVVAGHLKIAIVNSCAGTVQLVAGLPQTTKPDRENHGIGLRNIRRTLKKYGGVLSLDPSQPGRFALNMLIPFPEETVKTGTEMI